ncbi:MAG: phytanoyl-CoA dioxygenase [Rhodobacteraceae bacterium]|nr:phytanoyl-CoA dioxygenase [Paracoccaceae bacterium]
MRGDHAQSFEETGRVWLRGALSESDLHPLDQACVLGAKAGARMGQNGLAPTLSKLTSLLSAKPVRIVAFHKSKSANWGVPWHQDRVIAVKTRHEVEEFTNWSQKAGVWHCEPPLPLLERILFVRVHLDDTDAESGAMEIAQGSHNAGKVRAAEAAVVAERYSLEQCTAKRGDVLVLKMLTLHRSGTAQVATSRREVRIDFAGFDLPNPLEWAD